LRPSRAARIDVARPLGGAAVLTGDPAGSVEGAALEVTDAELASSGDVERPIARELSA
jgi:hypothetical protein